MTTSLTVLSGRPPREPLLREILERLDARGQSLADAIRERELYFRVSVVGSCNLSCPFCHNEGAPTHGKMKADTIDAAVRAAVAVGFTRVQFTGGEPLLHPDIDKFVKIARGYVDDVGVTTNGTYLAKRLDGLVEAGLYRLHVSLQTEPLLEAGATGDWGVPPWLISTVDRAAGGAFKLRLNLPVPADSLDRAERFLVQLTARGISVKVFSILPEGALSAESYPLAQLEGIVERVNLANVRQLNAGAVELRGYRPPTGIRCPTCADSLRCKEQSHSLRLGSDMVLRPCLATRDWDMPLRWPIEQSEFEAAVSTQAHLALDYRW